MGDSNPNFSFIREAPNEQTMKLFPILLAGLTFAQEELQAWEQFDVIEDDIAEIEQDLKDYQQVGICGSPSVSPNDWLFQNKFKRSTDDEVEDDEHSFLAGRIVGGQEAKAHSWPWMAFLDFGRKWCGGTIIHPKYIITAVHCVHKEALPRIILGAHDKMNEDQNVIVEAKKITLFPEV